MSAQHLLVEAKGLEPVEILPADDSDLDALVQLFTRENFALKKREWLDWKYRAGPYGPAVCFKVHIDGRLCGAAALLPRPFYWRGSTVWGLQAVDGLVGREARGRGLFNLVNEFLTRQRLPGVEDNSFLFAFASVAPSKKATVHSGYSLFASFEIYTCPLRPMAFAHARGLKAAWALRFIEPLWWQLLLLPRTAEIDVFEAVRFDEGFHTEIPDDKVHGGRSLEFMNWRVATNPMDSFLILMVRQGGRSVGYVVGKMRSRTLEIVEIRLPAGRPFLAAVLRHLLERGDIDSVDVFALGPSSKLSRALSRGFFRRSHPGAMFVYGLERTALPRDPAAWDLSYLDSDW